MKEPQLVQNLTVTQNIGIALDPRHAMDDEGLETPDTFCQYYGDRSLCELFDDAKCSHDGNLWGTSDYNAPYICTEHTFPLEQTGYEFVEAA